MTVVRVPGGSGTRRTEAWIAKVRACYMRDSGGRCRCFYCGKDVRLDLVRLDHFIPRSRGGPDGIENRRVSCYRCDSRKSDLMPWEFMPDTFARPDHLPDPLDPHPPWVIRLGRGR